MSCGMASALAFISLDRPAHELYLRKKQLRHLPSCDQLSRLRSLMKEVAPMIGNCSIVGRRNSRRVLQKQCGIADLVAAKCPFPKLVICGGEDGSVNHAFCVVDDLIFDSTQEKAMKLVPEVIHWICGTKGCSSILAVYSFNQAYKTRKRLLRKPMVHWYTGTMEDVFP